jgi:multisubunit Na+/H+ antiporter MnhB subunit
MIKPYKTSVALLFSAIFHLIAVVLIGLSVQQFIDGLEKPDWDLVTLIIKSINTLVIALAMYELGIGVGKEYTASEEDENIFQNIRRSITRFVGTVCIALVLKVLIMIIKYSQLDLAGNLYYPVAILVACSFLLLALGGFLSLTHSTCQQLAV